MSLFTDSEMYSLSGSTGVPTGEEGAWVSAAAMPEARPDVQSRCSLAAGLFSMGCCALKACALAPRAYAGGREMSVCAEFSLVVRISSVRCFHALRGALYKVAEMLVREIQEPVPRVVLSVFADEVGLVSYLVPRPVRRAFGLPL